MWERPCDEGMYIPIAWNQVSGEIGKEDQDTIIAIMSEVENTVSVCITLLVCGIMLLMFTCTALYADRRIEKGLSASPDTRALATTAQRSKSKALGSFREVEIAAVRTRCKLDPTLESTTRFQRFNLMMIILLST